MILAWADYAWEDYLYWQTQDKKTLKRINLLIKDIMRHPFEGLGEPDCLSRNADTIINRRTLKAV